MKGVSEGNGGGGRDHLFLIIFSEEFNGAVYAAILIMYLLRERKRGLSGARVRLECELVYLVIAIKTIEKCDLLRLSRVFAPS